jgi:hypothetical protein
MSDLRVASLRGRKLGTVPTLPDGAVVTGVTTSTSFSGNVTGNVTGNVIGNSSITGTTGTFTGNVSVGGTLTYDDVTDIDSVGVVTARAGIKIGAGQSVSAVSGITTYYGDGSQLTGIDHGVVNFVASGNISNGATVIIKTDGTVGIVTLTTSNTPNVGTPSVFASASTEVPSATYDSTNNKLVIAYRDAANSDRGTAIVGTVSGTSISFGSEVVFETGTTYYPSITFVGSGKVVIAYNDASNSQHGTAVVGTISGTSISFGTPVVFNASEINYPSVVYDSNSNKVVICYQDNGNGNRGTAIIGTVSGTSISFAGETAFDSSTVYYPIPVFDSTNNKIVISYSDGGDSNYGNAIVGTVSGNSISFGSQTRFTTATYQMHPGVHDSANNKIVFAYKDTANSNYGTAIVGTVSGTSISFGTAVVFESASITFPHIAFDSSNNKVVTSCIDGGNSSKGTTSVGTVSGTSISFGTPVVFGPANTQQPTSTYDSTNKKVIFAYRDASNSDYGTAVNFGVTSQTTNLTSENYIGIAAEAISNTATGKINVVAGTNSGQTGLTTAQKYFVQPNGTLGTSAGSPSVVAGTAISSTKIVVR